MNYTTADYLESLQDDLSTIKTNLANGGMEISASDNFTNIATKTDGIQIGGGTKYTGHADVVGLTALGWNNDDIKFFQDNCVDWNEENDDDFKVQQNDINGVENEQTRYVRKDSTSGGYSSRYCLIGMPQINTSSTQNFSYFFGNCSSLKTIPKFNTSSATIMSDMFSNCTQLKELDLSNIITNNITTFYRMFNNCYSLEKLNLSNWILNNPILEEMFSYCFNLKKLDLSSWTVNSVSKLKAMCWNCYNLTEIKLFTLNDKTTSFDLTNMFSNCRNLNNIDLSNLKISPQSTYRMFLNCFSLKSVNLSEFDDTNTTLMDELFKGCKNLTSVNFGTFQGRNITSMASTFNSCTKLQNLDLSNFNPSNLTIINNLFNGCTSLNYLDVRNIDFTHITGMTNAFAGGFPNNCLIIVKDNTQKNWFNTNFNRLNNVKTVAEYEE